MISLKIKKINLKKNTFKNKKNKIVKKVYKNL